MAPVFQKLVQVSKTRYESYTLIGYTYKPINPLKTKRTLLYLKTQFVPRSKHLTSRL